MGLGEVRPGQRTEIGGAVGVAILVAVLVATFGAHHAKSVDAFSALWTLLWQRNEDLMTAVLGAALMSATLLVWETASALGLKKTGKKIDSLNPESSPSQVAKLKAAGAGVAIGALIYLVLSYLWLPAEIAKFQLKVPYLVQLLTSLFKGVFASLGAVASYQIATLPVWKTVALRFPRRLPPFPKLKNTLVLGSVDEEEADKKPSWALIGAKGLVGNILITGSIGSGKSAGTVFSYARQLLHNLDPRPAVLAVDPKGKIAGKILEIAKDQGLAEHVLHMRLDGDVTFNPIYMPNALKAGGFSDISKMIRSAAVNYMGKSFDSPFWEQSASTLVKNCLIHCAATKPYYTLNDLYTTMVRAVSAEDDFVNELDACLKDGDFDVEERANISFALQYFRSEYRQLDEKVRTGILATSTTFLNQFQEYQASEIFCPDQDDLSIRSMANVLDEGKILLFDITNDGLARSMGTFIKLHYEKAILKRLKEGRSTERSALLIVDEYQDVVTTGYGSDFGDETFLAEGREANAISIMATQSLSSLENSIGRDKPTQVLWSGFRTKILGHSSDLATIKSYQELAGKEERKRISRSVSEHSQESGMNLGLEGAPAARSNVSESVSASDQKEYIVTAQDFARLNTFESFMMMFDGVSTVFKKLYLKPYYLPDVRIPHKKLLASLKPVFVTCVTALVGLGAASVSGSSAYAFPNVCTVLKTSESSSCMNFNVGMCMCGFPPRPCANFSYYVPQTFVEVMPEPKSSFFGDMPGAAAQLASLGAKPLPYGAEADEDTHAFQSHVTSVPFTEIPFETLPCGGGSVDRLCFEGMSEHLGSNWTTGSADSLQPNYLAWGLSPKACLLKGAAMSIGGEQGSFGGGGTSCSFPMSWLPKYPPSSHSACTGWGLFYPRSGIIEGPAQTTGALMIAARMKSLSSEVFHAAPASADEYWQMIYPQSSSCFRDGQNVAVLDTVKNVREIGRLTSGKLTGYLFTVWSKVSCCRDLAEVASAYAALAAMNVVCQGLGSL